MDSFNKKEIINEPLLTNIIKDTVFELSQAVTSTMGPYGNTVILTNKFEGPYTTKDGVSVIKAAWFDNPAKNVIAKLIKEVAEKTLKEAGDGTTTAVCLLQAILSEGYDRLKRNGDPLEIQKELTLLEKYTIELLEDMAEELDQKDIFDVATISANGDENMGKIIESAFKHTNNVKVEEGYEPYDKIEKINGMIFNSGYLDPAFINKPEKDSIVYDNPKIIIVDGKLTKLDHYANLLETTKGPHIFICDDMSANVQTILRDNYNRGALTIGIMKTPGFGGHRKNLVKDLKLFTDHTNMVASGRGKEVFFGTADSITISRDKTIITKHNITDKCNKYCNDLKKLNKKTEEGQVKDLLEKRIENLEGKMSIIKVGGTSSLEVKEKFDRYDDAVKAVTCALDEGIVPGGGLALYLVKDRIEEMLDTSFTKILTAPLNKIELNSNYKLKIIERDLMDEKIYDPVKVTKTAFKNAISISKALLSTSNLIIDSSIWK